MEIPLLPLQCPLVVLLPLSDTSPLSFHGSPQAARETSQREIKGHSGGLSPGTEKRREQANGENQNIIKILIIEEIFS